MMTSRPRLTVRRLMSAFARAGLVLIGSAIVPAAGFAQMGYQAKSLEWLVADSQVVVRATVSRVERVAIPNSNLGHFNPARFQETITLRVGETIKGDRAESFSFAWERMESDHVCEGWRDAGREALWFFKVAERREPGDPPIPGDRRLEPYELGWAAIRLGPAVPEERGLKSPCPPIFAMDLSVLREPAEILAAARRAAREEDKARPAQSHRLDLGSGMLATGFGGDANSLKVPRDARLGPVARKLIASPGGLLRLEGVKALRDFKSDENIALLKTLLEDPTIVVINGPDGPTRRTYVVRLAAYENLLAWGVAVPEPTLRASEPPARSSGGAAR